RLVASGLVAVLCFLVASLVRAPWPIYSDPRILVVIAESDAAVAEALPDAYTDWPASQRVDISLVTPDGAIDEARALEMAATSAPPNIPLRVAIVPLSSTTRSTAIPLITLVGTNRFA